MAKGVLWDVGNVIVRWNPRTLYSKHFDDPAPMERFLADVCTGPWNERIDAGEDFAGLITEKTAEFPEQAELIGWWRSRWPEMLSGIIEESAAAIEALHGRDVPQFALTNMGHEAWAYVRAMSPVFDRMAGVVVSAEERVIKPDPRIFEIALARTGMAAADLLFIDDNPANIAAARALGFDTLLFDNPSTLHSVLVDKGLL